MDSIEEVNRRFNEQLERYAKRGFSSDEFIHAGRPMGVVKQFLPDYDIMLTQRVLSKAIKKHGLSIRELSDLPGALTSPIFVFKNAEDKIGVLTSIKSDKGNNLFIAVDINERKQMGHRFMEVNDIVSIHGREAENIINPIVENNTLQYVDKEKGLQWLSSAELNPQAIASETLSSATKIVQNFQNPILPEEKQAQKFRPVKKRKRGLGL